MHKHTKLPRRSIGTADSEIAVIPVEDHDARAACTAIYMRSLVLPQRMLRGCQVQLIHKPEVIPIEPHIFNETRYHNRYAYEAKWGAGIYLMSSLGII